MSAVDSSVEIARNIAASVIERMRGLPSLVPSSPAGGVVSTAFSLVGGLGRSAKQFRWALFFVALMAGSSAYEKYKSDSRLSALKKKVCELFKSSPESPIIAAGLWVFLRVVYRLGIQLQVELGLILCALQWAAHKNAQRRTELKMELQRALAKPHHCHNVLAGDLPLWVKFPTVQQAAWLNSMISNMWPYICSATKDTMETTMRQILKQYKPGALSKLEMHKFSLGDEPLVIEGIQYASVSSQETIVDYNISWKTDKFAVGILAGTAVGSMEATITNFHFKCTARVTMGPHFNRWPIMKAITVSLLGSPHVAFDFTAAKMSLDVFPGLRKLVDDIIRDSLAAFVFPKKFIYRLTPDDMGTVSSIYDSRTSAIGKISVKVHGVKGIPSSTFSNKYSVRIGFAGDPATKLESTKKKDDTGGVIDFNGQVISLKVYDQTREVELLVYRDDSKVAACRTFKVSDLMHSTGRSQYPLRHPKGKDCQIVVDATIEFKAYQDQQQPGVFDAPEPKAPQHLPSRTASNRSLPHTRLSKSPSREHGGSATLFIILHKCTKLKNYETFGTSDPYVVFSVGGVQRKSKTVDDCLDPIYNDWETEIELENVDDGVLSVNVWDKDVGADKLMASAKINTVDVFSAPGMQLVNQPWPLTPQGNIFLTLSIRLQA